MSTTTVAAAAKMTSTTAVAASLVLSSCVIANAFRQKKQFYPSVVYICKSNPSMAVMYMQALVAVYLLGKLTGKIFFGTLRPAESERLVEKAWYAVTETCLAFTIFKDDLSPKFVALFTLLLFLKCFHWLAEDRVDYMERTPIISYIFHIRIWLLLSLLTLCDIYFVHEAYLITMSKGPSVQLVFGFEYALLITLAANAAFKYVLHALDVHSDTFWESKAVLLLYLEFFIGMCKAVMYVVFLIIMVRTYTIPLFAFRPMYHSLRNFKKVFQDLVLSRRAIHNMNTLYPDATIHDLEAIENVCIICREDMTAAAAKKLPCNHIFHTSCLRSWFQRHQTCPTCRLDILRSTPVTQTSAAAANPVIAGQQTPRADQGISTPATPSSSTTDTNTQRPSTSENRNNNDNNSNNIPEPNYYNESFTAFMEAAGVIEGIDISTIPNINRPASIPLYPIDLPFVGGVAVQAPELPDDLDVLTDEELRIMEQNTREGCIARFKYVTDIKCMLETTMSMMKQYSAACQIAGVGSNVYHDYNGVVKRDTTENDEHLETRSPSNISSESNSSERVTSIDDQLPQEETEQQRIIRLKRLEKFSNTGSSST